MRKAQMRFSGAPISEGLVQHLGSETSLIDAHDDNKLERVVDYENGESRQTTTATPASVLQSLEASQDKLVNYTTIASRAKLLASNDTSDDWESLDALVKDHYSDAQVALKNEGESLDEFEYAVARLKLHRGDWDMAGSILTDIMSRGGSISKECSEQLGGIYVMRAELLDGEEEFERAAVFHREHMNLVAKTDGIDSPRYLQSVARFVEHGMRRGRMQIKTQRVVIKRRSPSGHRVIVTTTTTVTTRSFGKSGKSADAANSDTTTPTPPIHSSVSETWFQLASSSELSGDWHHAEDFYRLSIANCLDTCQLVTYRAKLARTLLRTGKTQESVDAHRQVLRDLESRGGCESPMYLLTLEGLAFTRCVQGGEEEAVELLSRCFAETQRLFPDATLHVLAVASNLNAALLLNGEFVRLLPRAVEHYNVAVKMLGSEHERSLYAMQVLARCFHGLQRFEEALGVMDAHLGITRRVFGETHVATIESMRVRTLMLAFVDPKAPPALDAGIDESEILWILFIE
ncbi:hypothetical protein HDU98_004596 [Podochytrium sp. JEL0797]|nr:hypothetical protein HDU98_004596 [Podochytrium sp. JEL0797]